MASQPSDANQIQGWTNAQAQSQAFAASTNANYTAQLPVPGQPFPLGGGSVAQSSFFTNGNPPNVGNT